MLKITEHFHIPYPFQLKITAASYHFQTALLSSVHFALGLQKNNYYFSNKYPRIGFFFLLLFYLFNFFWQSCDDKQREKANSKN